MLTYFKSFDIIAEKNHSACSAACIRYPETQMDMTRVGILQYGFWPSNEIFNEYLKNSSKEIDPLKRVIAWKSYVMSLKKVKKGNFVGYGNSFQTEDDKVIAVIPIGYETGYSRNLSNQGQVLINGEIASIIGMINMNMFTVDVTHIKDITIGSEVVLIGDQLEKSITVSSFSDLSSQLNYELLTRLPSDIPRKVIK